MLGVVAILLTFMGNLAASSFKVIHNFGLSDDGSGPRAGLTSDARGDLFGTTAGGGDFGNGVVFELNYSPDDGWTETLLHSFNYQTDGQFPDGALVFDPAGNLYGTTPTMGPQRAGTVFELTPDGNDWDFSLLYEEGTDGGVVLDEAGNVYAPLGLGQYNGGAIGKLSPGQSGWNYTAIYSFCFHKPQCFDGIEPQGPLAWDNAGNLYGNTLFGGIYPYPSPCASEEGCGVVFQLRPHPDGAWSYHILHWFGAFPDDGVLLNGGLVVDAKGNVYGTSSVGGPTFTGTVFQLSPQAPGQWGQSVGYSEIQLYTFPDCTEGCEPLVTVTMDRSGNLYGAAEGGNSACLGGCGVIYRLSPQRDGTWKYSVLHKFDGADGNGPWAVTVGADGNLYGTTAAGGQQNAGVVFEIAP